MSTLYIPNSVGLNNFESLFKNNDFNFSDNNVDIVFHPKYIGLHAVGAAFYASVQDYFLENNINKNEPMNQKSINCEVLLFLN